MHSIASTSKMRTASLTLFSSSDKNNYYILTPSLNIYFIRYNFSLLIWSFQVGYINRRVQPPLLFTRDCVRSNRFEWHPYQISLPVEVWMQMRIWFALEKVWRYTSPSTCLCLGHPNFQTMLHTAGSCVRLYMNATTAPLLLATASTHWAISLCSCSIPGLKLTLLKTLAFKLTAISWNYKIDKKFVG